ncbi:MAG TPA: YwbE family protein [Aridibacter sp.]|nr:YwbE family protein [Aridibacter sp.]
MPHHRRENIAPGTKVIVVVKQDQRTGAETRGIVRDILTRSAFHPHGIKVRLEDGRVGRVKRIIKDTEE